MLFYKQWLPLTATSSWHWFQQHDCSELCPFQPFSDILICFWVLHVAPFHTMHLHGVPLQWKNWRHETESGKFEPSGTRFLTWKIMFGALRKNELAWDYIPPRIIPSYELQYALPIAQFAQPDHRYSRHRRKWRMLAIISPFEHLPVPAAVMRFCFYLYRN